MKEYTRVWKITSLALLVGFIFLPRLIGLGRVLTVDEPLWQSRARTFITALASRRFDQTLVAGQPGVTTAGVVGLASRFQSLAADQTAVAVLTGFLILLIAYFLILLWGWYWGVAGGVLLALDPFLIAHSRLVHTDGLLALFYTACVVTLLAALEPVWHGQKVVLRYFVLSAILGGLALLTKLFAILLLPTAGAILVYTCWKNRTGLSSFFSYLFLWSGLVILTIFVLWPALWTDADTVYNYLFGRTSMHAEGTRIQETTSRWWYYLRESFFRITPLISVLIPITVASYFLGRPLPIKRHSAVLMLSALFYGLVLSFSSDKSDRYVLPALVLLCVACTYAVFQLFAGILKAKKRNIMLSVAGLLVFLALVNLVDIVRIHPYYLAYFNHLYPVEKYHKLGWGEGLETAAAWVAQRDPKAKVITYYPRVFAYFYSGGSVESIGDIDDSNADYLVLYRSMFERGDDAPETDIVNKILVQQQRQPEHIVTVNGLPFVWIYKLN